MLAQTAFDNGDPNRVSARVDGLVVEALLQIERAKDGALLEELRERVLRIAAISRGWTTESELARFRAVFNIGPLFEASALALLWRDEELVGIAGTVHDWTAEQRTILHLCSLGFLPSAQGRNYMTMLMGALWRVALRRRQVRDDLERGRVVLTAISQSPLILTYLHRFARVVPSPYRSIEAVHVAVARQVVQRFDPHLRLDEQSLILRGEAAFGYRRTPYGTDRAINDFCDERLDYARGDVFVMVGEVLPERVQPLLAWFEQRYPQLWAAL